MTRLGRLHSAVRHRWICGIATRPERTIMKNILAILTELKSKEVTINIDEEGTNLKLNGRLESLSQSDKERLKTNKETIIAFLKDKKWKKEEDRFFYGFTDHFSISGGTELASLFFNDGGSSRGPNFFYLNPKFSYQVDKSVTLGVGAMLLIIREGGDFQTVPAPYGIATLGNRNTN